MCKCVRRGFTLIELLSVVAIILLLMALLFPALQATRESANRAACMNNLRNIGIAYKNLYTTTRKQVQPIGWVNQLAPFAENNEKVFRCPNDFDVFTGQQGTVAFLRVYRMPQYPNIDVALTPGAGGPPNRVRPVTPANPVYATNPGALEMELSQNWDYNDLTVELVQGPAGITLVRVLLGDQYQRGGNVFNYRIDLLNSNGQVVYSGLRYPDMVAAPGGVRCSYGINGRIDKFSASEDTAKVLAVEYKKISADVIQPNATDFWVDMVAVRHRGVYNVLFYDGRVERKVIDDLDPRVRLIHDQFWKPTYDR